MTTPRKIINRAIAAMCLDNLDIEPTDKLGAEGPTLSRSLPVATAKDLCAQIRSAGLAADLAPDGDDASEAWVYVCNTASDLDVEIA